VAYFVDTFANHADPQIGLAAVAVLRHNGVTVHVPWRQRGSGMPALTAGDLDTARETAAYNLRTLAELARDGYTVVCSEPTAAVALTQEYPRLVPGADAALVAANTVELTTYLLRLHAGGKLRTDFAPLAAGLGHHVPCHVKALRGPAAGPQLLGLLPGAKVHTIDAGCSGMAGTWGVRAAVRDVSLAAGAAMAAELDRPRVLYGSTECGACRVRMQHVSGKRTLHPVQYLALSYGLLPTLDRRLGTAPGTLITD
jgi:Fe-S oxidoreductase